MQRPAHPATDLIVAALVLAVAVALFVGAARLPPPRWEPLGSAAVPRALGTLLALFAVLLAAGALRALILARDDVAWPAFTAPAARMLRGSAVLVAVIAFVVAMDRFRLPFVAVGPVFVVAISVLLGGLSLRVAGFSALWGVVLCFGLHAVFTRFFYINLP